MPPEFVAFRDLPKLLGVSRTTAHRWVHLPHFPKPDPQLTKVAGARVWSRAAVIAWKREHGRALPKPGRPRKTD